MDEFKKRTTTGGGQHDIRSRLDKARQAQPQKNPEALHRHVAYVCAAEHCSAWPQDEALVGCSEPAENDGNFRALLRYRMRGSDVTLCSHVTAAAANATYLSATIHNEFLVVAADLIREKYKSEFVRQAAGH